MKRFVVALAVVLVGCGTDWQPSELAALETALHEHLEGRDLGLYVTGLEGGGGNRVQVLTQLTEDQVAEAEAICNTTTVAAHGVEGVEVSGVDVAAAGGRYIATCDPKV